MFLVSMLGAMTTLAGGVFKPAACKAELRGVISDRTLLSACELLIGELESRQHEENARLIAVTAASYRLRGSVARCQQSYSGVTWDQEWAEIRPHLSLVYDQVLTEIAAMQDSECGERLRRRVTEDAEWMGLMEFQTASTVR